MFGSDLENGLEALGDEHDDGLGEQKEVREERSNWKKEKGIRWTMRMAYEETHKKTVRDDDEEETWKRSCKARVQETNEKQHSYHACYLSEMEGRRLQQVFSSDSKQLKVFLKFFAFSGKQ